MRAGERGLLGQGGAALLLVAVAHAVKAGQVGEGLAGSYDVVGRDGGGQVGKLHLDDLGTLVGQGAGGGLHGGLDLVGEAGGLHERGDHAHDATLNGVLQVLQEVDGAVLRGGVVRVSAGAHQGVHGKGHVLHAAAEGADLVK